MEEKIKIYLPKNIYDVLLADMDLFEFHKKDGKLNKNDFLNALIYNYYQIFQNSNAAIYDSVKAILDRNNPSAENTAVSQEILHYIEKTAYSQTDVKAEQIISVKPTKKTAAIFDFINDTLLNGLSLSNYFRNMFASYISLPRDRRERIIFKENIDIILEAIRSKKKLFFTMKNKEIVHSVSPYSIASSKEELFNYLLGEERETPRSYRISRITKMIILNEEVSFIDGNKEILQKMEQLGPQFSITPGQENYTVIVEFTERGKKMLKSIYIHRPALAFIQDEKYYFTCSSAQAFQYFCRFGKQAKVLSPASLVRDLAVFYKTSLKAYEYSLMNNKE